METLTIIYDIISIVKWPIVVVIAFLAFYKPIYKLISNFTRIKAGPFEADTSSQETKEEVEEKEGQVQEDKYKEEKEEPLEEVEQPKNLDEWRREMIFSFWKRNREGVDKAFQEVMKLDQDNLSRKNNEILFYRLSHPLGNTDAIQRLQDLRGDTDVAFEANMALGFCYANSGSFERSTHFYAQALEDAQSDDERSRATSAYSSFLYYDDKKNEAIEIIVETLSIVKGDTYKISLYKALADVYKEENDNENRAIALEKAIELKPNDSSLIFEAAYSYSHADYDALSLLHYKNARELNPEDEAVQNNLGVQYDELKMPIKSIQCYREAERFGNTLASANLAYRLINAGFTKEANDILSSANSKENVHANVNSAISIIPKDIEKEDKIEEEHNKSALKLRKWFLGFAEAKYIKGDALKSVSGDWKSEDGTIFHLNNEGGNIVVLWEKKILLFEEKWKFEGKVFNNSSVGTTYEAKNNFQKGESEYEKEGRGFLFCTRDAKIVKFIVVDKNGARKYFTLSKVT